MNHGAPVGALRAIMQVALAVVVHEPEAVDITAVYPDMPSGSGGDASDTVPVTPAMRRAAMKFLLSLADLQDATGILI
jgi:hypothetical protein